MSDQKIMDMFVEQSKEILELKGKLRIAIETLKYVSKHLDDGFIVDETINKLEAKNEKN